MQKDVHNVHQVRLATQGKRVALSMQARKWVRLPLLLLVYSSILSLLSFKYVLR
jgi:hypothetical protein